MKLETIRKGLKYCVLYIFNINAMDRNEILYKSLNSVDEQFGDV